MAFGSGSTTVPSTRIVSSLGLARTSTYFSLRALRAFRFGLDSNFDVTAGLGRGARNERRTSKSRPRRLHDTPRTRQSDNSGAPRGPSGRVGAGADVGA